MSRSTPPSRSGAAGAGRAAAQLRTCPHCASQQVTLVARGLAGVTDERDQFYTCADCGRTTYELVARSRKELIAGRMEAGREVRVAGMVYTVSRVLRVGLDEHLVYLKPTRSQS